MTSLPPEDARVVPTPAAPTRSGVGARVGARLGVSADARRAVVRSLFARSQDELTAYWLQLLLAIVIATLGLVMGSGAVIIGAMLISPLMAPIVELALSLLIGAGSVMVGAAARVTLSVALAVGLAGLVTRVLPFNEPSSEILARVSPTVLDLFVAMGCAVAAAYVTARPSGGGSSTAAGTAIGISLVPPLCTVGFGLGVGDLRIAEGALLLFVANFTAILACATLFFWLVGFRPLPSAAFDGREPGHYGFGRLLVRVGRRLDRGIASRFHLLWRLAVPLVLVLAVSVPLQRAYREMAWQLRTRAAIAQFVASEPLLTGAVHLSSVVEGHRVALRAVVVGDDAQAASLTTWLEERLRAAAGVRPVVTITAVPPAAALEVTRGIPLPALGQVSTAPPPAPAPPVRDVSATLAATLDAAWPASAGTRIAHALVIGGDVASVRLLILGDGLEPTAVEMLERGLTAALRVAVSVEASAVPAEPLTAPAAAGGRWLGEAERRVALVRDQPAVRLCVGVPPAGGRASRAQAAVETWTRDLGSPRVQTTASREWSLRLSMTPCP